MIVRGLLCAALLAAPLLASAQPRTQTLTMEQAVAIAMEQQPSLRQSRAQVEAARGRVDQAEANRIPQVTLSTQASVGGGGVRRDFLGPTVRGQGSIGASASWRVYDFGLTAAQIRAAELSAQAATIGIETATLDVRQAVERSYLEAVARARLVAVADETVRNEEAHVDQAKRFVAAQAKDPIEVVQAQSRYANAKAALAQARSSQAIALANLRAAIGWIDPTSSLAISDSWPVPPTHSPPELVALVETARKGRPEIEQLDLQVRAAEASIEAAKAQRRPVLSMNANTAWAPATGFPLPDPSWSVGVALSWQAFDAGRSAAEQRIARANRESALAQRDALLLDLTTQLDSTRAQIEANRAALEASAEAVTSARAQLHLAEARYAQGLGSQIELADAQTAVTTAEGNLVQSEWQLATAWAALRRALGEP
jgi:outer membrane protein